MQVSLSPCFSNLFKVTFFPELLQWNLQTIITSHIYTPDHKVDPKVLNGGRPCRRVLLHIHSPFSLVVLCFSKVKQPNPGDQQDVATRMRRAMRVSLAEDPLEPEEKKNRC